jgi:hypothetical protein
MPALAVCPTTDDTSIWAVPDVTGTSDRKEGRSSRCLIAWEASEQPAMTATWIQVADAARWPARLRGEPALLDTPRSSW